MPEIYRASNVQEAVEMAEKLKDEGRFDWFRGQTREWPPHSSLFRCQSDPIRRRRAYERYGMFFKWLSGCPELKAYTDFEQEHNVHAAFAILQHYGVPTHYIDFTTDPGVAGFFASGEKANDKNREAGCIYCLNTEELLGVWESIHDSEWRKGSKLELVAIDVTNLWRLQAQKGVFLFCNYNWDMDFPMDRILFPCGGCPSYPTRESVYPIQKSPLELTLDRYFDVEAGFFSTRELKEMLEHLKEKGANASWYNVVAPSGFYAAEAVRGGALEPLPSWSADRLVGWLTFQSESLQDVGSPPVRLRLDSSADPRALHNSVVYGVGRLLRSDSSARQKTLTWQIQGLEDPSEAEAVSALLANIWNGMRWLPFGTEDIAEACGSAAALLALGLGKEPDRAEEIVSSFFGGSFQVEFGAPDGSGTRGYVSRQSVVQAVRADIREVLTDEYKPLTDDPRRLLSIIYSPSRLFEFDKFVSLFAREIIPTQALTRGFKLFSPAQLQTFGLP